MIPSRNDIENVHRRYAINDDVFTLVYGHCKIVAEIALWCVEQKHISVDTKILEAGCLLHDIGTYALFNEQAKVSNEHNYVQHAIFGAALALEEGFDPQIADMIRTHVLMGLTKQEIVSGAFPLPQNDYTPTSAAAELLCYADTFHSKRPVFNMYETFITNLAKDLPEQAAKLKAAATKYGIPDVQVLAKTHKQPVR